MARTIKARMMVALRDGRTVVAASDATTRQVSPPNSIPGWGQVHGFDAYVDCDDPAGNGRRLTFIPSTDVTSCWVPERDEVG